MARKQYDEVHADVQAEFDSVIATTDFEAQGISIEVLGDENQKKDVIKVKKVDDINYHRHKVDVFLTVNQGIFEQLTPEQKVLAIEDALATFYYNHDREMIATSPVDVKTHSLLLRKHSYDNYEVFQESLRTLFAKKEAENK